MSKYSCQQFCWYIRRPPPPTIFCPTFVPSLNGIYTYFIFKNQPLSLMSNNNVALHLKHCHITFHLKHCHATKFCCCKLKNFVEKRRRQFKLLQHAASINLQQRNYVEWQCLRWVVIRPTTLFNLQRNNVAWQVAAICHFIRT